MIKVLSREPDKSMLGFSAEVASDCAIAISTLSIPLYYNHVFPSGNLQ